MTTVDPDIDHTVPFHCVVRIPARLRNQAHAFLRNHGIESGVPYPPNHRQPAFADSPRPLPVTEAVSREILSLPFHPAMTTGDAAYVVHHLVQSLAREPRGTP